MKILIIGGGQMGSYIAKLLLANNNEVSIIENREKTLNKIKHEFPESMIIQGSGSDAQTLELAGIQRADVIVAVTGADEVNLVVSTIAKYEYGAKRVIARVNNPRNTWLFNQAMGVDVAVNQADLISRIVMDEIDMKSFSTLLRINQGKLSIVQLGVSETAQGANQLVKDLVLPAETVLISVIRHDEVIAVNGNTEILPNDTIIALTNSIGQYQLNELFA